MDRKLPVQLVRFGAWKAAECTEQMYTESSTLLSSSTEHTNTSGINLRQRAVHTQEGSFLSCLMYKSREPSQNASKPFLHQDTGLACAISSALQYSHPSVLLVSIREMICFSDCDHTLSLSFIEEPMEALMPDILQIQVGRQNYSFSSPIHVHWPSATNSVRL